MPPVRIKRMSNERRLLEESVGGESPIMSVEWNDNMDMVKVSFP